MRLSRRLRAGSDAYPGGFSFLFCSSRRSAACLWRFLRGLRLLDDLRHVFQQFLCVVDYAVLDRPSYSADAFDLPSLIVQPNRARAVQDLQIRDRVFGNDDQIGQFARSDNAELHRPSLLLREQLLAIEGRRSDHFERMEARLLQQLQLAYVFETVGLEDEARIRAGGHATAAILELVNEGHPEPVVVLPFDLVLRRPVEPVGSVGFAARLIEFPKRRQRVAVVPLGPHRAHQVAAGLVDGERRVDSEVELDKFVHHLVPLLAARRRGLFPQSPGLAEAVLLVVIVVIERKVLHDAVGEERFWQAVPMLHRTHAHPRGLNDVGSNDARLSHVRRRTHLQLLRLVEQRAQDFGVEDRVAADDFEAVRAFLLRPADVFTGEFRGGDLALVPTHTRADVGEDARRDYLILRAALALAERPIDAVARAGIADRSHAVRHPQLVDVFGGRPLREAADVRVAIDEARQHVHPGGVDLLHAFVRAARFFDGHLGKAHALDLFDPVVFDDDVDRAHRRSARAVDHRRAANDQPLERPFAFTGFAIRGGGD